MTVCCFTANGFCLRADPVSQLDALFFKLVSEVFLKNSGGIKIYLPNGYFNLLDMRKVFSNPSLFILVKHLRAGRR